jgi:hypothetical protein
VSEVRTYIPAAEEEPCPLAAMQSYVGATAVVRCEGLTDHLAHAAPLPTPGGVVPTCPDLLRL